MKHSIGDEDTVAVLVRKLRTARGMTQQQLAEQAGVSFSFVNQVEGGKPTVRLDALNKLLHVFGYTMTPAPAIEAAPSTPEPDLTPVRQKNDWSFY